MTISADTDVVDLMSDVDFEITTPVDAIEALQATIFGRSTGKIQLPSGKYNVRMLCVITRE